MVQRYNHVAHDIYFMKLRSIVVSLAIFCAFLLQGSNCYKVSVSVYHEENFAVRARQERDTVAVDPSYFNNDDEPFTEGNTVPEDNSVLGGSTADNTLLHDDPPKTEHKQNGYRQNTLPGHSKAKTFRQKSKHVTGNIKHISQENKQEIEQETDANNPLIMYQGHVIRQRRAAGWSVDDENNRASRPGKRRRRKKKKTKQEAMLKYVKENMFKVVVVPILVVTVVLGGFIWYRCCMEGDVCCLCRACPCACCHPKAAAQAGMQGYVAGVRRDDKGGYYYDELTQEEVKAAEQMGEAVVS